MGNNTVNSSEEPRGGLHSGEACILVKDKALKSMDAPFWSWLREHGFQFQGHGHWDHVDWVFINVNSMVYMPGMPGMRLATPLFNHAITVEEFLMIWDIYSKYQGLDPLKME